MQEKDKYIENKIFVAWVLRPSDELANYWSEYLTEHPEEKEAIDEAALLVKSLHSQSKKLSKQEKNLLLDDFRNRIQKQRRSDQKQKYLYRFTRVAAIIIFLIVAVFVVKNIQYQRKGGLEDQTVVEMIIKSNPAGVKSLITLPDGSKIKLNSESQISFNKSFLNERKVLLTGEAYFEVITNLELPFIVEAGEIGVKVLGTSFNVQAFPHEKELEVMLVEGKVEIQEKKGEKYQSIQNLRPGEMFVYDANNGIKETRNFDPKTTIGWKDGELNFKDLRFDEVVALLERWYGVQIEVKTNKTIDSKYEGYYKDEQLSTVLEGLSFVDDFDFQIEGNKVTIN